MSNLLQRIQRDVITPALALLPDKFDTPAVRVLMLAIGLQESELIHRWQIVDKRDPDIRGPARGLWQFERMGGVAGVMTHRGTKDYARAVCALRGIPFERGAVWRALADDDILAAVFARLLILSDPRPVPGIGKGGAAWDYYLRNWRPGKPHPSKWSGNYARAVEAVTGE